MLLPFEHWRDWRMILSSHELTSSVTTLPLHANSIISTICYKNSILLPTAPALYRNVIYSIFITFSIIDIVTSILIISRTYTAFLSCISLQSKCAISLVLVPWNPISLKRPTCLQMTIFLKMPLIALHIQPFAAPQQLLKLCVLCCRMLCFGFLKRTIVSLLIKDIDAAGLFGRLTKCSGISRTIKSFLKAKPLPPCTRAYRTIRLNAMFKKPSRKLRPTTTCFDQQNPI